jgi:hypothetical protein
LRALGRHSGPAVALTLQLLRYISVTSRVSVMQFNKVHEAAVFQSVVVDELPFKPQLNAPRDRIPFARESLQLGGLAPQAEPAAIIHPLLTNRAVLLHFRCWRHSTSRSGSRRRA